MTPVELLVTAGGLALATLVAWFFWFSEGEATRADTDETGAQDVTVTVRGGYTPDLIVVQEGRPVRLHFKREETAACSEMVLLPDFDLSAKLPAGKTTTLEFTPQEPGEYPFACQMGMYRGKVVVEG